MYRVGIDIGGTFTDLLLVGEDGAAVIGKTLTTPGDPSLAVENALRPLLENGTIKTGERGTLLHGTTLVTNALIERKGAPTALLTTIGFRDAVEIGREHRYELYDLNLELPKPLVPRHLRFDVPERIAADGSVLRSLDEDFVRRLVAELRDKGIKAIAVSYLNSFRNSTHERRTAEIIAEVAPKIRVSLSSEVVAEIREFQRTSTTLANVYVQERVADYLAQLQQRLDSIGFVGSFFVMLSSGGIATRETASRFPVRLLESGPAAGALAAAQAGILSGHRDLLSFDMGGTTAKLCVIENGQPSKTHEFEVDRVYRFRKGSGLPVRIPVIDMIEIGAGGGSIARVDSLGLLKVGPDSSGADPGPVCYSQGGTEPTVTDADLVLGYLDPDYFLGGKMQSRHEAGTPGTLASSRAAGNDSRTSRLGRASNRQRKHGQRGARPSERAGQRSAPHADVRLWRRRPGAWLSSGGDFTSAGADLAVWRRSRIDLRIAGRAAGFRLCAQRLQSIGSAGLESCQSTSGRDGGGGAHSTGELGPLCKRNSLSANRRYALCWPRSRGFCATSKWSFG